jgi:hypothetical protein
MMKDEVIEFQKKALARTKAKNQSEAEQLFNQYCYPKTWYWEYPEWKQAALSILSSGIFEGTELKGHARHKQTYPVDLGHLITDLVRKHYDYDVNLPPGQVFHRLEGPLDHEIVSEFDEHFRFVAAIVRLCGVRKDHVQNIWDDWRKQVSTQAVKGKISPRWRQVIMDEIFPGYAAPKKIAYAFADIFLQYASQARPSRMVHWVNVTLESLGRPMLSKSSLNDYISKKQQQISQATPFSITE